MKYNYAVFGKWMAVLLLIGLSGICYSCGHGKKESFPLSASGAKTIESGLDSLPAFDPTDASMESSSAAKTWKYVHICGEVERPGVYQMEEGQRIYELVERAGGYTEGAASDYLNLAETMTDGMKVVVPHVDTLLGEGSGDETVSKLYGDVPASSNHKADGKINLNTATKEQLMTLSGIGEARAEDIIQYRESKGGFVTIEDIMKVSGIKAAAFEKIKEDITVG